MTVLADVDVLRGGTAIQGGATVREGLHVQIDNLPLEMAAVALGSASKASPFDVYSIYVFWASNATEVQLSDLLIDKNTPDPRNGNQPTQYRVIGNIAYFSDDHHMELKAVRIYGT